MDNETIYEKQKRLWRRVGDIANEETRVQNELDELMIMWEVAYEEAMEVEEEILSLEGYNDD